MRGISVTARTPARQGKICGGPMPDLNHVSATAVTADPLTAEGVAESQVTQRRAEGGGCDAAFDDVFVRGFPELRLDDPRGAWGRLRGPEGTVCFYQVRRAVSRRAQ